jgi:hypothetical protein
LDVVDPSYETQIDTCRLYALSQGWKILSRAVLETSTGEITLGLVDDAAEIVGKAAEQHTT